MRHQSLAHALPWLRKNVATRLRDLTENEQKAVVRAAVGTAEPGSPAALAAGTRTPRPDEFLWQMNLKPWFELIELKEPRNQADALWLLTNLIDVRPSTGREILDALHLRLLQLLHSKDAQVRDLAYELAITLAVREPSVQPPEDRNDIAAVNTWFSELLDAVFPAIESVHEGFFVLRTGEELDTMMAQARELFRGESLGKPASETSPDGQRLWGFRLERTPAPMDQLGFVPGVLILSIQGTPVRDHESILKTLESVAKVRATILVEWSDAGVIKVHEYRVVR